PGAGHRSGRTGESRGLPCGQGRRRVVSRPWAEVPRFSRFAPSGGSRMRKLALAALAGLDALVALCAGGPRGMSSESYPAKAAPDQPKPLLENDFVLVLDVSIPAGVTV